MKKITRQAEYERRKKAAGELRISLWLQPDKAEAFQKFCERHRFSRQEAVRKLVSEKLAEIAA